MTRLATAAGHAVFDWNLRLVRALPDAVGRDRMAQIESDLWEQSAAHRRRGGSDPALALSLLLRAVRGLPADIGWWWGERRPALHEGMTFMTKKRSAPAAKPWVHLAESKPFDQTNGIVDLDPGPGADSEQDEALRLLEAGVRSNMVNVGFGGAL